MLKEKIMNKLQKSRFKDGSFEMDINVSLEDNSIWLNKDEIALLFDRDRTVISKHINSIYKEDSFSNETTCAKFAHMVHKLNREYITDYYNLDIVLVLSNRLKNKRGVLLKDFVEKYFSAQSVQQEIVIYNNGSVNLSVNVSPEEDTVWLNVNQIATLFESSTNNIYMHINNIFEDGELPLSLGKDSLLTDQFSKKIASPGLDGKTYYIDYYNLDVILAIGYRVKSQKAIDFRRWASRIIKQYLLKGYAIDANRVSISKENYLQLENDVANIKKEIVEIKQKTFIEPVKQKIFFDGEFFDAHEYIASLLLKANKSIIIIDPYFDIFALDYLKNIKPSITKIIISSNGWLPQKVISKFIKQYGEITIKRENSFHDRFIIIDEKLVYSIGASLNYAGKRAFGITIIEDTEIINSLISRVEAK